MTTALAELEAFQTALLAPILAAGGGAGYPTGDATDDESAHATRDDSGHATRDDSGHATGDDSGHATRDDSGHATREDSSHATRDVTGRPSGDSRRLLKIALANEINVSELAAAWMPTTPELDVKLAFARQAGDEAGHFMLVAERLAALGFDAASFAPPAPNPMFVYLRGLTGTVDRIAAGLFTLEALAYAVNERFMALCAERGDAETVRIYREYIQPDERAHQQLGRQLLAKYATTPALVASARATIGTLLELAASTRAQAAARLGTACFPGC